MSDRRAVAGLVGAVLLFGILVISLSLYQAQVVPSENRQAEFEHNQQVQNQLTDVRNAILRTAWSENSQPTSVTLGTRYPSRTFAVNPPPATGRLATEELGNVTLTNVTATSGPEGLREYLNSTDNTLTYTTSALVYAPDYNEYRNAPRTVYENTLLYNNFTSSGESRYLPLTDDSLVSDSGDRVSVVVLQGQYSESGIGSATVDPESVSTPQGGVFVKGSLNVSVPTRYPANGSGEPWSDLLSRSELRGDGRLNITFENGTNLRIGAVSIGSGSLNAHPAYITRVSPGTVTENEASTFTVRVHDQYLNPYEGATVTVESGRDLLVNGGANRTTGSDGTVTFEYEGGTGTITLSLAGGEKDFQYTKFDVTSTEPDPVPNAESNYALDWQEAEIVTENGGRNVSSSRDGNLTVTPRLFPYTLDATTKATSRTSGNALSGVSVDYATEDPNVAEFDGSDGTTGADGLSTVPMTVEPGETTVYASASGASDRLNVSAEPRTGGVYYRYYEGDFSGDDPPEFGTPEDSGTVGTFSLSPREREIGFGFNYTAYVNVPEDGDYTFSTTSDDGSWLYVDGQRIVDNGGDHGPETASGTVTGLSAGWHTITVVYYQSDWYSPGNGKSLTVSWNGPSIDQEEEIPQSALAPRRPVSDNTEESSIRYDGGLGTTQSGSSISFDITNTGAQKARINGIRVTSNIDDAGRIWKTESWRQFGYEVYIPGGETTGFAEAGSPQNYDPGSGAYYANGDVISLSSNAVLSTSGDSASATIQIGQFGRVIGNGNNFRQYEFSDLTRVGQSSDWDVSVEIQLQNRESVTYYFQET